MGRPHIPKVCTGSLGKCNSLCLPCNANQWTSLSGAHNHQSESKWLLMCVITPRYILSFRQCIQCQNQGGVTRKKELPFHSIIEVGLFDVQGINFIGPIGTSYRNNYTLVVVDYVYEWQRFQLYLTMEGRVVQFLKTYIS